MAMPSPHLEVDAALPAWNHFNNVDLVGVAPKRIPDRGVGLVAERDLSQGKAKGNDAADGPALARIPRDLVLSRDAVESHAKADSQFRELLDAVGRKSTRADVCLFLLCQRALASAPTSARGCSHTPWTEYIKFLPSLVPVPTTWPEEERQLLSGTSLESAVGAKIRALTDEFEELYERSSALPFWNQLLWDNDRVTSEDWFLVDAWYRSRSLELPHSGEAMVPVIDLANHSSEANAYYEERDDHMGSGEVVLLPRPGCEVSNGDEVTISYGAEKSGAEMLFSYGFIDPARSTETVTLPMAPMEDDPLGRAKLHAFPGPATVRLGSRTSGGTGTERKGEGESVNVNVDVNVNPDTDTVANTGARTSATWSSPFAWLMCLNEEDGLEFRVLQDLGGERELRVFWQDEDVTARLDALEELARSHPLSEIFRLRVVAVVEDRVSSQMRRLVGEGGQVTSLLRLAEEQREREGKGEGGGGGGGEESGVGAAPMMTRHEQDVVDSVKVLRDQEVAVLEAAARALAEEKAQLLTEDAVVAYLGSMEVSQKGQDDDAASNGSDDFS